MANILLVEDEEQVRVLANLFCKQPATRTLSAGSVDQALALFETEQSVDLLFIDLKLQGDNEAGLALATEAVKKRPDLSVLYTSAQGVTDGMIALFVEKSAFLPKPYTVEQLATVLSLKFDLHSCSDRSK